jgi:hypothetical protein
VVPLFFDAFVHPMIERLAREIVVDESQVSFSVGGT